MEKGLYEIFVPTQSNEGKPFRTRFHKVWDAKVREITGGLTILPVAKGQWLSPSNTLYIERMIPVRIVCNREEIEKIMEMSLKYYNQEAILAYKISDEVIFKYAD